VNRPVLLGALALAAALAGCGNKSAPTPGLLLNEPSAVAVFRGRVTSNDVLPFLAVANAGSNDIALLDAVTDGIVPAPTPVPLRTRVIPLPGRPTLLASARFGDDDPLDTADDRPDLLVAVSAEDNTELQVIRTWATDNAVVQPTNPIDLGADILSIIALPSAPGTARIAAALAGKQVAVVTFRRITPETADHAIDVEGAVVVPSPPLAFQPVALAATPGDTTRLWAATRDPLPNSTHGVAGIDVGGATPTFAVVAQLDALAPTRLVAAARLAERALGSTEGGSAAFDGQPTVDRVYAVLDESGCGLSAPISCGVVALDPAKTPDAISGSIPPDPTPAGSLHAPYRAPISLAGSALAIGASPPPVKPPPEDAQFAGSLMRMQPAAGIRATTGAAAVASSDGAIYFVDLGRWEIPNDVAPPAGIATPTPVAPASTVTGTDPTFAASVAPSVQVTPGYTPTAKWIATYQGALPGLVSRRAESRVTGELALQATVEGAITEAVQVYDPAVGILPGDLVAIADPDGVGSCTSFEVAIADFVPPGANPEHPNGALQLGAVPEGHPEWSGCPGALANKTRLRATVLASGWLLTRTIGTGVVLAGRPTAGTPHLVQWEPETMTCPAAPVTSCDATCRQDCERLRVARLGRRIAYVPLQGDPTGPALALTVPSTTNRGLAVTVDTTEGRTPFRGVDPGAAATAPRSVVPFDRSPQNAASGVRFFVPYASGVVLDASPTLPGGNVNAMR
jgi:hypothetical protein